MISEVISVNVMELCKQHDVPGPIFHIQGTIVPTPRCVVLEDMLSELYDRGLVFITRGKVCGGVKLSSGASLIYKHILDGELETYLNLTPRCSLHQEPYKACGSLAPLYNQGGVKNVKMLERLKRHLKVTKVTHKLFETSFEVQLRNEDLYEELFPQKSNRIRFESAILQTASMLRKHA